MLLSPLLSAFIVPVLGFSASPRSSDDCVHVPLVRRGLGVVGHQDTPVDLDAVYAIVDNTRSKFEHASCTQYSTMFAASSQSLYRRQNQGTANFTDGVSDFEHNP